MDLTGEVGPVDEIIVVSVVYVWLLEIVCVTLGT